MLAYQIVAGFSEIKSQFRIKENLTKPLAELQLWFSFEEDILYVHDFHDHEKSMALAIYNGRETKWWVVFRGKGYGRRVIEYAIDRFELNKLAGRFYKLYRSHGYL